MTKLLTINAIDLKAGTTEQKREEILTYFEETFHVEEKLYEILQNDNIFYQRADPLRHPLIFYYGHTAVFFINKLILAKLIDKRINPEFESIFAIGVDEMSWDDLNEKNYNWPTVAATATYRKQVKEVVVNLIKTLPLNLPIDWNSLFWPILMGIEHERIHIETSSVLIRQLPIEAVKQNIFGKKCTETNSTPYNELIEVKGGKITLGKNFDHQLYGWDNEYGTQSEDVKSFKAAKFLVSNGEFLEFVNDAGYKIQKYWTKEGWAWRTYKKAEYPLFWLENSNGHFLRLIDEIIPMPWDWPVEVNYLEAKAFCNWKSERTNTKVRMPTEAEWYKIYETAQISDIDQWTEAPGNINLEHFNSSCPVNKFKTGNFYDIIGNVWQWTETPITGFPGFKVHRLYDDFSTPTFDTKHNLIKGGSWISTGNEASKHARYAFRRHFYQHAGFRYIISEHDPVFDDNSYETDKNVAVSCENNYGENYLGIKNFYQQIAETSLKYIENPQTKKVLDINCDTGRLAFELAKTFDHVTALDASARFIRMAINMQEKYSIRYVIKDEGDLVFFKEKQLKDFDVTPEMAQKIKFMQTDAANIKPIYTGYDLIIATNLIEELYAPEIFLKEIHKRLNTDGILIIGSAYDWNIKNTKKENWLGGFKKDGEPVYSFTQMSEILAPHLKQINNTFDLQKVVRLTSRNFNVQLQQISVWKKQ